MIGGSLHELGHLFAHLRRVANNVNASGFEGGNLVGGSALATSNDGTGVTHATAWRSSLSSDEADDWQLTVVVLTEPLSGLLFGLSADLTDHDYTLGLGIIDKLSEDINKVGTVEGIATDTNNSALSKSLGSGLVDSFIGEGS